MSLLTMNPTPGRGLLDALNTDGGMLALNLLAAAGPSAVPMSFGQRLAGAWQQTQQHRERQQERDALARQREQQMALQRLQMDEVLRKAKKDEAAAAEAQRLQSLIVNAVSPVAPIQANAASGIAGPRPEALAAVGTRPKPDFAMLIAQGVPPDVAKALAEAPNLGRPKVARTVKGLGADGREYDVQMDDYGSPVGAPIPQYKAPLTINQGNRTTLADPYTFSPLSSFQTFQSPDSAASVSATLRGQNLTDARARDANQIAALGNVVKTETDLRKEFADLPEVKRYKAALPAFRAVEDAASRATPQSDINLIYGLAKLYDPDSVVREGEYDTIARSQSIPEWIKGQAQRLAGGGRLTPETKGQILQEARGRIGFFEQEYGGARQTYSQITQQRGGNPANVFTPVGTDSRQPSGKPRTKTVAIDGGGSVSAELGPDGNYYVRRNGKTYRVEE